MTERQARMSRRKRPNLLLRGAQEYLNQHIPELNSAPLHLRPLDGPPEAPRYAVTAEVCCAGACPRGVPANIATMGQCAVLDCPLRDSVRLLLDQRGSVIRMTR